MLEWTTACPDWRDRIREGRSLVPCGAIFPDHAQKAMEVFESLLATDVQNPTAEVDEDGRPIPPTYGEVSRQWILDIAIAIHGSYDVEAGERLIREVLIKVPKKNWKSGLAAGLMLSLMILSWRPSNEAGVIAPTKETADNVFKPMKDAIEADPELAMVFHIQPNMRTITHRVTGMTCRVYAADTETVSGKKWAFVILEELWLLAQRAGAEDMVLEATGGQASRPEGVVISITTESNEEPVGVYKSKLELMRKVRDGEIHAPHLLPVLYEWPEEMLRSKAYLDPENHHLVNPNWGASVDPVDFAQKFQEAVEAGGIQLRGFLAKRLNVPPSESVAGSWSGSEFWVQCADTTLTLQELIERCEVIEVGIDGGGLDDLLGVCALGRETDTGCWLHWGHALAHPIALERRKSEIERLKVFEDDGDLTLVEEVGDDVEWVGGVVERIEKSGKLDRIGVDQAGIAAIVEELIGRGIGRERILGIPQGWRLNGAIATLERKLMAVDFQHGGRQLMAWAVGNAKQEQRGNAKLITKQHAGVGKIDPLLATFNAAAILATNPESPKPRKLVLMTMG